MAHITRRPEMLNAAGTPAFILNYKGLDGRRHRERLNATTEKEAERIMAQRISEMAQAEGRGATSVEAVKLVPLREYVEKCFLPHCEVSLKGGKKGASYRCYLNSSRAVLPILGDKAVQHIRPRDIREYIRKRRAKLTPAGNTPSPSTVNRDRAFLSACLELALQDELIPVNPVPAIKPLVENKPTRWLTPAEVGQILAAIDAGNSTWLRPIVVIAVNTGMRLNEVLALTRSEVEADQLRVTSSTAKNKKERYVKVTPVIRQALKDALAFALKIGPEGPSTKLFHWKDTSVSHAFKRACGSAGLDITGPDKVVFHTLRHTACSWMVQDGEMNDRQIMAQLGHGSSQMVSRYAHLGPESLDRPAAALEAAYVKAEQHSVTLMAQIKNAAKKDKKSATASPSVMAG